MSFGKARTDLSRSNNERAPLKNKNFGDFGAMKRLISNVKYAILGGSVVLGLATSSHAQSIDYLEEFDDLAHTRPEERLQALGDDLMGDMIDPNTGSIVFEHVDVSLPGNSGLEVAFRRKITQDDPEYSSGQMGFASWSIDVPQMSFMFIRDYQTGSFENNDDLKPRPSQITGVCPEPVTVAQVEVFEFSTTNEFIPEIRDVHFANYGGSYTLSVPGRGSRQIFGGSYAPPGKVNLTEAMGLSAPGAPNPPGGVATIDYWTKRCGPEGWVMTAPNGDEYIFGKVAYRSAPEYEFAALTVPYGLGAVEFFDPQFVNFPREHVVMLATEVRDVNGNWVKYEYANNDRGELTRIHSNDGRNIDVAYESNDVIFRRNSRRVASVTANGRSWTYHYQAPTSNNGSSHNFTGVTLPDGRSWDFSNMHDIRIPPETITFECASVAPIFEFSMVHPDGTTGTFKTQETRHLKSTDNDPPSPDEYDVPVPEECQYHQAFLMDLKARLPFYKAMSVIEKKLEGPGVDPQVWTYDYSGFQDGVVPTTKWTDMTDPAGTRTRMTYSRVTDFDGLLLSEETFAPNGQSVRKSTHSYIVEGAIGSIPFDQYNFSVDINKDYYNFDKGLSPRPRFRTVLEQDGETYTTTYTYNSLFNQNYSFGQPVRTTTGSTLQNGGRRTDVVYEHKFDKWILNLPQTIRRLDDAGVSKTFEEAVYDALGRMTSVSRFGHPIASYTYHTNGDQAGRVATITDSLNRTMSATNYKRGTPQSVTRPDNASFTRVVDDNGWILSQTDVLNRTTSFDYTDMGRLTLVDLPGAFASTTISYATGTFGTRATATNGAQQTVSHYDSLLRPFLTETVDLIGSADTVCNHVIYDERNRERFTATRGVDGSTNTCRTRADILAIEAAAVPYAVTSTAYLSDNRTRVTDAEGHVTTTTASGYGSPGDGNPIRIDQPENVYTAMTYDIFGNLLSATQGLVGGFARTQDWVYDDRLRPCRHTTPETGSALYQYDNANQVIGIARGQGTGTDCASLPAADKITNQYDVLGRVDLVSYGDGAPSVDFEYDLTGTVDHVIRGISRWDYVYNELDALTSETLTVDARTYQMNYTYDANGYMASSVLADGQTVSYGTDGFGRPTRATIGGTDHASGVSYDIYGALTHLDYGNGATLREGRNGRNQTIWRDVVSGSSAAVSYTYDHDLNGRITSILDGVTTGYDRTFGYDGIGRLITANGQWGAGSYVYDGLGNLRFRNLGSRTVQMSVSANNRIQAVRDTDDGNVWRNISYDARGNVIAKPGLGFVYDLSDQPVSMSGDVSASFVYDGNYKRVKQTIDGETIYTVYNQAGQVAYRDNITTGEATNYVRMGGRTVVRFKTGGTGGLETAYLHADHLGSPVAATDETGAILWAEHFTPYGENIPGPAANPDDEGFTGHIQDTDTGLTYMQARFYDPMIGRFLSNDPVGFEEGGVAYFNRYAYTANDPVNLTDPTGMCAVPTPECRDLPKTFANSIVTAFNEIVEAVGTGITGQDCCVPDVPLPFPDTDPASQAVSDAIVVTGAEIAGVVASRGSSARGRSTATSQGSSERPVDIYEVPGTGTPSGKPYVGSGLTEGNRRSFTGDGRDRTQSTLVERVPESQRRTAEQRAMNDRGGVQNLDNRRNEIRESCWPDCGIDPPG